MSIVLFVEQTMACCSKWSTPVTQLPKNVEVVKEELRDIVNNKGNLGEKMKECLGKHTCTYVTNLQCAHG